MHTLPDVDVVYTGDLGYGEYRTVRSGLVFRPLLTIVSEPLPALICSCFDRVRSDEERAAYSVSHSGSHDNSHFKMFDGDAKPTL